MQRRPRPNPAPAAPSIPTPPASLLTTVEVARLLRVHPKQVYRLFARGLPKRRVGSEWRYDRDEVLRWSSGGESPAAMASPPAVSPLLACNGDAAVELLLRRVRSNADTLIGTVEADRETGLALLRARRVLAAGYHGAGGPPRSPDGRLARLHLVRREVGLVARAGRTPRLDDLLSSRLASRAPTAGVRQTLDRALGAAGFDSVTIHTHARACATHLEVVNAVASSEADVGVATHAWARRLGLSFVALEVEDYGVLVRAEDLGRPEVVRMCESAQEASLRAQFAAEAGYDARDAGALRFDPDAASTAPAPAEP